MTHVSKKKLPKDLVKLFSEALTEIFQSNSKAETTTVLASLLTKTETAMLYKRLMVMFLLNEGLSTDEIARSTNTTRQTVLRVASQMKLMKKTDKKLILNKLESWKRRKILKSALKGFLDMKSPSKTIRNKARKAAGW